MLRQLLWHAQPLPSHHLLRSHPAPNRGCSLHERVCLRHQQVCYNNETKTKEFKQIINQTKNKTYRLQLICAILQMLTSSSIIRYMSWVNLTFWGQTSSAVLFQESGATSQNIVFDNCQFIDQEQMGLEIHQTSGISVTNSIFTGKKRKKQKRRKTWRERKERKRRKKRKERSGRMKCN